MPCYVLLSVNKKRGIYTKVDVADYLHIMNVPCRLILTRTGYAAFENWGARGKRFALHRFLLALFPENKLLGDHINMDRLDNRRINLRIVDWSLNNTNKAVYSSNKLGLRGIRFHDGKYEVRVTKDKTTYYYGRYQTKEAAVEKRNEVYASHHGEFIERDRK